MTTTIRSTTRWRHLRAHVLATRPPICTYPGCDCPTGRTIDLTLNGRSRWGPTVDHVIRLTDNGAVWDERNLRVVHNRCNMRANRDAQRGRSPYVLVDTGGDDPSFWWLAPSP